MIGFPNETADDIKKTWELARWIYRMDNKAHILLHADVPYHGNELTRMLAESGYQISHSIGELGEHN